MLRLSNVRKAYDGNTVFSGVSFCLSKGDRVGLIGPNGGGKSTLLAIAAGKLPADGGTVWHQPGKTVGYLDHCEKDETGSTIGMFLACDLYPARQRMSALELKLSDEDCIEQYEQAIDAFEAAGGYAAESQLEKVMGGLGLASLKLETAIDVLSGGQKTRLALARILLIKPDLLLLDEPANNLDLSSLAWLEKRLLDHPGAIIVASHDRAFLDAVTTRTFELDSFSQSLKEYGGNYSWYEQRRSQERTRQWRQYNEQQQKLGQLKKDIQETKQRALATELTTVDDFYRGRAKKVAAKAKARQTRLGRLMSVEERIEKPRRAERIRMHMAAFKRSGHLLMEGIDADIALNGHVLLHGIRFAVEGASRIAVVGDNGTGKTTLLRAMVGQLPVKRGQIWRRPDVCVSYLPQMQEEDLPLGKTVLDYFRETVEERAKTPVNRRNCRPLTDSELRTFLHRFLFSRDQVFKQIGELSHGQRTKLLFAKFMACGSQMLVLDEPTNFLDIPARECLEEALRQYGGALIVVSHDRFFLQRLELNELWSLEDGGLLEKGGACMLDL